MNIKIFHLLSVLLLAGTASALEKNENLFKSPSIGFSIVKLSNWHFLSTDEAWELKSELRLKDEELQKNIQKKSNGPFMIIAKYPVAADHNVEQNPAIQVALQPLGELESKAPRELGNHLVSLLKHSMPEFKLLQPIVEKTVDGRKAAYFKASVEVSTQGGSVLKSTVQLWAIPRGKVFFVITASIPAAADSSLEKEIEQMIATIKIDP